MSRPALLLLSGTLCDARLWDRQRRALEGEAEVLCPDVTGHDTVEAIAAEVLAGAPPRFVAAGFSFGGFVAQALARLAPSRVAALCLLSTNGRPFPAENAPARRAAVAAAGAAGLGRYVRETMMGSYLHASRREREDLVGLIVDMAATLGPDVFARQVEANITRPDGREAVRAYPGPTFILCGEDDQLCPPEVHRELAAAAGQADLTVLPEVGHFTPLEAAAETTALLRRALATA